MHGTLMLRCPREVESGAGAALLASLENRTGAPYVAEAGVRVERMKIESDPNFKPAVPVVAVAVPFRSTVQLPFPEKGASVSCWERDTAGVSESFLAVSPDPI